MNILKTINWVDILMLVLLIRLVYISVQTGFVIEFFKLSGLLVALFICFHWYTFGVALVFGKVNPPAWAGAVVFVVLWSALTFLNMLIRNGIMMVFTVQAHPVLDKWGAATLSIGRFFVTGSMILFTFFATGGKYFETVTMKSATHKYIVPVAPNVYRTACDGFVTKLFPSQRFNPKVGEELNKVRH